MKIAILAKTAQRTNVFDDTYFDRMRKHGELSIFNQDDFNDRAYLLDVCRGANVIITTWGTPKLEKDILEVCPDLQCVIHAAGTPKPVITPELIDKKVRLTASNIAIGEGVAETALALMIGACKKFFWLCQDTANGMWAENKPKVKDFYDIKVGIVSGGMVGRHMVKLLKNFHVDILMYDPTLTKEEIAEIGAEKVGLDEMMSVCDVVSIHAPSIPATDNMINQENLKWMKDGAVLVNTARGSIIHEADLIEELKKGRIYACLDVTLPEPPAKDNPLRTLPNVVLTPHIAGTVTNGLKRIALHACEELDRFCAGERMKTEVNFDELSQMA